MRFLIEWLLTVEEPESELCLLTVGKLQLKFKLKLPTGLGCSKLRGQSVFGASHPAGSTLTTTRLPIPQQIQPTHHAQSTGSSYDCSQTSDDRGESGEVVSDGMPLTHSASSIDN